MGILLKSILYNLYKATSQQIILRHAPARVFTWIRHLVVVYAQGCIYMDSNRNLQVNLDQLGIKTSNCFATLRIKNHWKHTIKITKKKKLFLFQTRQMHACYNSDPGHRITFTFTWISPKETIDLTSYLIIIDLRHFSRTPVTFFIMSIKLCYLTLAAAKHVRINLGQLRIKTPNWFTTLRFNFWSLCVYRPVYG